MLRRRFLTLAGMCAAGGTLSLGATTARAGKEKEKDPKKEEKYKQAVAKGLEWLAKNQSKDGHWEAFTGQYPVTMTAMGGMALLMEGSNVREGKYKDNIRRACQWLMDRSSPNGMIGNPNIPGESGRYTYGHGYAMMFLACIYGEEEEGPRRTKLEDVLTRAAKFSRDMQTSRGGWLHDGQPSPGVAGRPQRGHPGPARRHQGRDQLFEEGHEPAGRHHLQSRPRWRRRPGQPGPDVGGHRLRL
jgi:hypothetical protein